MGLGRRTFSPGEVLTASNVMNYLQDQAVMSFAGTAARGSAIGTAVQEGMVSYLQDTNFVQVHDGTAWRSVGGVQVASGTAARDALLPSPVQGDKVFRSDLGYEQTYYSAWGTANPGGRASAGWYDNQRNMGLVPIVPPTVNYSGGTATANSLGLISFTSVTSISLNNVFTSAYRNYRLIISAAMADSVGVDINCRFRVAGTDVTSGYYGSAIYQAYDNAVSNSGQFTNTSFGYFGWFGGATRGSYSVAEFNPNGGSGMTSTYSFHAVNARRASQHIGQYGATTATFPDGVTLYPASSNFTGTIQVFGYNA